VVPTRGVLSELDDSGSFGGDIMAIIGADSFNGWCALKANIVLSRLEITLVVAESQAHSNRV
jgi:hypothetical protein